MLVQLLQANGISGMELIHLSAALNSKMYHTFKGMIDQGAARFPNYPLFVSEVKNLEAEVINKYMIRVAAPAEKGSHDDMCDAAAIAAMLAVEWAQEDGSREVADLMYSQSLIQRSALGVPLVAQLDLQNASLQDLKLLERQARIKRNMMGMPSSNRNQNFSRRPR